eukprot:146667_1
MGKRNKKKQQNKRQNNKKKKHYNGKHPESQQQNAIFDNLQAAEHILNDEYISKTNNNNKNYNKQTELTNQSASNGSSVVTPVTPEPLTGIRERNNHRSEVTMELSVHLDKLDHNNNNVRTHSTDRMLDEIQNTQGMTSNEIVGGSVKHIIQHPQQQQQQQ